MGNGSERGEGGLRATVSLNPQSHRCSRQRAKKKIDGGGDPPFPVIPSLFFTFSKKLETRTKQEICSTMKFATR